MLNDIHIAEQKAEERIKEAHQKAEELVQRARVDATQLLAEAEQDVREMKARAQQSGTETGAREAKKIIDDATATITKDEARADQIVSTATERIMRYVHDML